MDKVLKEYFDSFIGKGLPPSLKLKNVKLFDDISLLAIWRSNFKGISYTDSSGNVLRGAVDNILVKSGKFIVLDYKTRGFPLKDDTAAHYQNQLDIYNFLLRKNGYKTHDYAYLFFYHPSKVNADGTVLFNTDLVKMKIDVTNAERILSHALKVLSNNIPDAAEECKWCG